MKKSPWLLVVVFSFWPVIWLVSQNLIPLATRPFWSELLVAQLVGAALFFVFSIGLASPHRGAVAAAIALLASFVIGSFRFPIVSMLGGRTHVALSLVVGAASLFLSASKVRSPRLRWVVGLGALFLSFLIAERLQTGFGIHPDLSLRLAWIIAVVGLSVGAARALPFEGAVTALTWIGAILVVQPAASSLLYWALSGKVPGRPPTASRPVPPQDSRDVYFVVLDGYGREDVLREFYGMERDELSQGLRQRGFFVSSKSKANYTQTLQSLAATLGVSYLQDWRIPGKWTRRRLTSIVSQNSVRHAFELYGYGTEAVLTNSNLLPLSAKTVTEHTSGVTLLARALLERTPFFSSTETVGKSSDHRQRLEHVFNNLPRPVSGAPPRFVIVHLIAPHPPFVLGEGADVQNSNERVSDGSHFYQEGGTLEQYRKGYRGQAEVVARRMLEWVDGLPRDGENAPIVIIQSDHGPKSLWNYERADPIGLKECLPILFAVRAPEELQKQFYDGVSPVNTFRIVLSHIGESKYPILPDKSYYSTWERPYEMSEVK